MRVILLLCAILASVCQHVHAKAVFAHFMVANTENFVDADWQLNYKAAIESKIDGFALNIGAADHRIEGLLEAAFRNAAIVRSATNADFRVFLNFDYAAGGTWAVDKVVGHIKTYRDHTAYFKHNNLPLVSTFEGFDKAGDWDTIRSQAGAIFFMPSWGSTNAGTAIANARDGLASWDAWPAGPNDMFSQGDSTFLRALGHDPENRIRGKPYMMPVSPWFFTRLPNFDKNWVWRGDSLWFDRWNQILHKDPEFVQIISWNDFGEGHYIGPLDSKQYLVFNASHQSHGGASYNYADGYPHDGWRKHLPYLIDMYKNRQTTINQERTVAWYRTTSATNPACGNAKTTGNSAAKLQATYGASQILQERIFYSALLGSNATVTVTVGGAAVTAGWETDILPADGVGIYHGSASFTGKTGQVVVTIRRDNPARVVMQIVGTNITTTCKNGEQNYNAWVGSKDSGVTTLNKKSSSIVSCRGGTGFNKYAILCAFTCKYGYCPDVCTCSVLGAAPTVPAVKYDLGCPISGLDNTYKGLCEWSCLRGTCPSSHCTSYKAGTKTCNPPNPTSPAPYVCKAGKAYTLNPYWDPVCPVACKYNQCKSAICVCTSAGPPPANAEPAIVSSQTYGEQWGFEDYGLCNWLCQRGQCPEICKSTATSRRIATGSKPDEETQIRRIYQGPAETKLTIGKREVVSEHVHKHAFHHLSMHRK